MSIHRTEDRELINSVLSIPGIAENVGYFDGFEPPLKDHHYLIVKQGEEVAGLFILHPGYFGLKIHANMIPGFRGVTAYNAAKEALDYGFEFSDVIYAEIPEEFPNVRQFATQFLEPVEDRYELHKSKWQEGHGG